MPQASTLTITARPEDLLALTPLLREGVGIALRPGLSLRQTMIQDLGFCPECVEERVQTVFLDGAPVDDIDAGQASAGCTLALAGALPGVAGIAMRRCSPVGVFREGIAHDSGHGVGHAVAPCPDTPQGLLPATLKLFNTVALECLTTVLEQGVEIRPGRLAELLSADPDILARAGFELDGRTVSRGVLVSELAGNPGVLCLLAESLAQTHPPDDLAALAEIAEAAGAAIMTVRHAGFTVQYKEDDSPLTRADLASHEIITRALAERFPGVPVLSEEGAELPFEKRARWKRLFIVDPLDGTKEFVKELGEFCVCIALVEDGFPTLGAVHGPVSGKTYVGGLGLGAFCREPGGDWQAIHVRTPDPHRLTALASRSHPSPETEAWLAGRNVTERITAGSALKFCLVAEGRADLYPRLNAGMREWDAAAGQAVLEGAGGSVVRLEDGQPAGRIPLNKPDLGTGPFLASSAPTPKTPA